MDGGKQLAVALHTQGSTTQYLSVQKHDRLVHLTGVTSATRFFVLRGLRLLAEKYLTKMCRQNTKKVLFDIAISIYLLFNLVNRYINTSKHVLTVDLLSYGVLSMLVYIPIYFYWCLVEAQIVRYIYQYLCSHLAPVEMNWYIYQHR